MPYTPTTWTAGVTPASQPNMNNLEAQYSEATKSLFVDAALEGFVASGLTVSKTAANQITMAAGTGWVMQTDGTLRRYPLSSTPETTSVINTTYFLDLKPDGTLNWATTHSGANYLPLASVTTDGSGNVNVITDTRPTLWRLFGAASALSLQLPGLVTATLGGLILAPSVTGMSASAIAGAGMGTGTYNYTVTFAYDGGETTGSALVSVTTTPGNNQVSLTGIPISADPRITRRKIYRSLAGGSIYYWVKTIGDNSTTTYTDTASDAAITSSYKQVPARNTAGGTLRSGYPWSGALFDTTYQGACTGVTFGQTGMVTGDSSTAALFNGTTDRISLPPAGLPSGNQPWSILAIAKPTNATNALPGVVAMFGNGAVAGQGAMIYQAAAGGWVAGSVTNDTAATGTSAAGAKHLIVGTWDGTTLTCNVDGGTTNTLTPGARQLNPIQARIGDFYNGGDVDFFPGTVQKVAIFNYALSAQQIAFYNSLLSGASGNITFDSQVMDDGAIRYYTLSDAIGRTVAAETTRRETTITADGTVSPTNLVVKGVGGAQTMGSFGVPAIVAQVIDASITSTGQQTILTYNVPVTGLYRVTAHFSHGNTGATNVTLQATYTDPHLGTPTITFCDANGVFGIFAHSYAQNTTVSTFPMLMQCKAGTPITVLYTDASGVPSDFVTAIIERLA